MLYVANLDSWTFRTPIEYQTVDAVPEEFRHRIFLLDAAANSDMTMLPHVGTRAVLNGRRFYYLCSAFKHVYLVQRKKHGTDRFEVHVSNDDTVSWLV